MVPGGYTNAPIRIRWHRSPLGINILISFHYSGQLPLQHARCRSTTASYQLSSNCPLYPLSRPSHCQSHITKIIDDAGYPFTASSQCPQHCIKSLPAVTDRALSLVVLPPHNCISQLALPLSARTAPAISFITLGSSQLALPHSACTASLSSYCLPHLTLLPLAPLLVSDRTEPLSSPCPQLRASPPDAVISDILERMLGMFYSWVNFFSPALFAYHMQQAQAIIFIGSELNYRSIWSTCTSLFEVL